MNTEQTFKIVLIGDGGCGKTTYINRIMTGEFEKRYLATLGVEVTPILFNTSAGNIIFSVWDTAGQEKFGGLRDVYYKDSDLAILFFDVTNTITFKNIPIWINEYRKICPNSPIILVGNKCDIRERKVSVMEIQDFLSEFKKVYNIIYFDISAKSNYNFEKPFLIASRFLTKNKKLFFIEKEGILPPIYDPISNYL